MIIAIDTSELKKLRIRVDAAGRVKRWRYAVYADAALPRLAKILAGKKPQAIGVVVGPGAFSATRTGVALANALAYAWGIPVIALTAIQFDASEPLPRGTRPPTAVRYGMAPNITKKKIL